MGYEIPFLLLISRIINLLLWGLFIYIVMGWLIHFNVINGYNKVISTIYGVLFRIFETMLKPFRDLIKPMGGMDLSPILLILLFYLVQELISTYVMNARLEQLNMA